MRTKKNFVTGALLFFFIGLISCDPNNASENDVLYEAIDKEEVEDPDDRGNS